MELLEGLLTYNPCFRLTIAESLKLPVFDQVRCANNQNIEVPKIDLDLHSKNDFDYEENKGTVFSIDDYKQMLKQEIKLLRKE